MPTQTIQDIMELASRDLAEMRYLDCESKCLEALELAISTERWNTVARIVLPLQEARRQRRMIAAEAGLWVMPVDWQDSLDDAMDGREAGCLWVHDQELAQAWQTSVRERGWMAEVLWGQVSDESVWQVTTLGHALITAEVPGLANSCWGKWMAQGSSLWSADVVAGEASMPTPGDWYVGAIEALGDAVLSGVDSEMGSRDRVDALLSGLELVPDHELLHQGVAEACRMLSRHKP